MRVDAAHPSDFDPVRMEPDRIEDTVCRTDDGVEKKQLRKFPFKVLFEAVLFFTYIACRLALVLQNIRLTGHAS